MVRSDNRVNPKCRNCPFTKKGVYGNSFRKKYSTTSSKSIENASFITIYSWPKLLILQHILQTLYPYCYDMITWSNLKCWKYPFAKKVFTPTFFKKVVADNSQINWKHTIYNIIFSEDTITFLTCAHNYLTGLLRVHVMIVVNAQYHPFYEKDDHDSSFRKKSKSYALPKIMYKGHSLQNKYEKETLLVPTV